MKQISPFSRRAGWGQPHGIVPVLLVLFLLIAGDPFSPAAAVDASASSEEQPLVTMRRTMCFGTCPVYSVTVFPNGSVVYVGEKFVQATGRHERTIDEQAIARLISEIARADVFRLRDAYTNYRITDMPSVILTISSKGRKKTIRHYLGDTEAPDALIRLEKAVDRISGVRDWIGERREKKRTAKDPDERL